jgi:hypothetical protein
MRRFATEGWIRPDICAELEDAILYYYPDNHGRPSTAVAKQMYEDLAMGTFFAP